MLKLAIKAAVLTVIIEAAALVFAEEMFITMLVLFTIAITATWLVIGDRESRETGLSRNTLRFIDRADRIGATPQATETAR